MKRVVFVLFIAALVLVSGFITTDAAMVELTNQPRVISYVLGAML